jgi:hypothetical protein
MRPKYWGNKDQSSTRSIQDLATRHRGDHCDGADRKKATSSSFSFLEDPLNNRYQLIEIFDEEEPGISEHLENPKDRRPPGEDPGIFRAPEYFFFKTFRIIEKGRLR